MSRGKNFEKILKEKGVSVNQVAKQINVPATTLYTMIQRDSKVPFEELKVPLKVPDSIMKILRR